MQDLGRENLRRAAEFFECSGDKRAAKPFRMQMDLQWDGAGRARRRRREGLIYLVVTAVATGGAVWAIRMILTMAGAR